MTGSGVNHPSDPVMRTLLVLRILLLFDPPRLLALLPAFQRGADSPKLQLRFYKVCLSLQMDFTSSVSFSAARGDWDTLASCAQGEDFAKTSLAPSTRGPKPAHTARNGDSYKPDGWVPTWLK